MSWFNHQLEDSYILQSWKAYVNRMRDIYFVANSRRSHCVQVQFLLRDSTLFKPATHLLVICCIGYLHLWYSIQLGEKRTLRCLV